MRFSRAVYLYASARASLESKAVRPIRSRRMKAGDVVALRTPSEILATLDESGATDGLPVLCQRCCNSSAERFVFRLRVERACDTLTWGVRRLPDAVLLDDLRCDGHAHGGCQYGCRLYWKEAVVEAGRCGWVARGRARIDTSYAALERLVGQNVERDASAAEERIFRCQATDWFGASEPIGWWNVRWFFNQSTCGDVGFWQFLRTMARIVLDAIGRRLHLIPPEEYLKRDPSIKPLDPQPVRGLAPGTLVKIRSKEEIVRTLDTNNKNNGLLFDPPSMLRNVARSLRSTERSSGSSMSVRANSFR